MMALVPFSRLPNGGNSLQQTITIWNILSWLASFRMRGPMITYCQQLMQGHFVAQWFTFATMKARCEGTKVHLEDEEKLAN
ncbi:hypothetical protein STEG23_019246 [Scotinomys teguina]